MVASMKPALHLTPALLLGTILVVPIRPAWALCPESLPVALLEECIVIEGLGQEYPVEEALAEWRRRHAGKDRHESSPSAARETGNATAPLVEKATP